MFQELTRWSSSHHFKCFRSFEYNRSYSESGKNQVYHPLTCGIENWKTYKCSTQCFLWWHLTGLFFWKESARSCFLFGPVTHEAVTLPIRQVILFYCRPLISLPSACSLVLTPSSSSSKKSQSQQVDRNQQWILLVLVGFCSLSAARSSLTGDTKNRTEHWCLSKIPLGLWVSSRGVSNKGRRLMRSVFRISVKIKTCCSSFSYMKPSIFFHLTSQFY